MPDFAVTLMQAMRRWIEAAMPDLGNYAGPVLAAYGISLGLLALLLIWARWRAGRVARMLAQVEKTEVTNG